jgi:hypothetical protein
MILGIVGSEGAKFTAVTETVTRLIIRELITRNLPGLTRVISGACHLGGIDTWAIEEATKLKIPTTEYPPRERNWSRGYRLRNIQIAQAATDVICITLRVLPPGWIGMQWKECYHCPTINNDHVKSGGCWTVKFAREKLGKPGSVIVIENE